MTFYSVSNPFMQIFNLQGTGLNDGDVYFGVAGQDPITNPKTVYWDIGGTDVASQPIPTTGGYLYRSGTPAEVYLDSTYSIKVLDKNGNQVYYQANVFDPVFAIAADLAAFEAALASSAGAADIGYTQGSADAVAKTVQDKLRERVSLLDFYTATDPDLSNALVKAAAYANGAGGYKGIMVPNVNDFVNTGVVLTQPEIAFIGDSNAGSILKTSLDGPLFTFSAYGGGAENLSITYPSAPPANAVVFYQDGGDGQNFTNLRVSNIRTLLQMGKADGTSVGNLASVSGLKGNVYNSGSPTFKLNAAAGFFLDNCSLYVDGVGVPTTNRTSTMTTVSGTNLLDAGSHIVDTISIGDNCIFERYYRVLNLVLGTSSEVVLNVMVSPTTICDYIREDVYHLEATAGGGGINNVTLMGYAGSWEGRAVHILGSSGTHDIDIDRLYSPYAGYEAVNLNNANSSHIRILQPRFIASDRLNTGVSGINYAAGEHVSIIQAESGYSGAYAGLAWQAIYGISVAANLGAYTIADCDCDGVTSAFNTASNASGSSNRRVRDNTNANYAGLKTGTAPFTDPGSTVAWVNTTPFVVQFSCQGAGVTSMQHNGTTVTSNSAIITVQPGETGGYNGTGTVQFFVEP